MNTSSDAAEQLVRISLNTLETTAKISGVGATQVAKLIYAVYQQSGQTKGKTRLTNMLKSGKELKVFAVADKDLQKFCTEAKEYGVLYCVLKDRDANDGITDIMVRAEDASKISRIFERFNLAQVDVASVAQTIEKEKVPVNKEEEIEEFLDKLLLGNEGKKQNSVKARTEKINQSEPSSENRKAVNSSKDSKPSVRQQLNNLKAQESKIEAKAPAKSKSKSKKKGRSK